MGILIITIITIINHVWDPSLAECLACLITNQEVAGSIPGTFTILKVN